MKKGSLMKDNIIKVMFLLLFIVVGGIGISPCQAQGYGGLDADSRVGYTSTAIGPQMYKVNSWAPTKGWAITTARSGIGEDCEDGQGTNAGPVECESAWWGWFCEVIYECTGKPKPKPPTPKP